MKPFFCVLGMLVTLFVGLFLGVALYIGITEILAERDLPAWVSTEGAMSSLAVEPDIGGTYSIYAEFSYVVGGERIKNDKYELKHIYYSSREEAQRAATDSLGIIKMKWSEARDGATRAQLSERSARATVYYHPSYPEHGVLRRGTSSGEPETSKGQLTAVTVLAVLTFLCAGGFFLCLRGLFRRKEKIVA